jgi:glyoxylase-like metal-dependent hydrolase (beta-lactamase superfamily II)
MAELKVLIEGYVYEKNGVEFASSTTVLIKDKDVRIIVDPGMDRELLLEALKKEKLFPQDIQYIVVTHTHLDHVMLVGIFERAQIIDDSAVYSWDGSIREHEGKIPGTSIAIIKTPGHDMFHCSVLVDTEEYGKVAIVADVLWWKDGQSQAIDIKSLLQHEDPYVKNKADLLQSRRTILDVADYVIPGHGKMFKVQK